MNKVQAKAIELIRADLRFLYTIFLNSDIIGNTYYIEFMPYMGIIIDGAEGWIKAYNNSNNTPKLDIPSFNEKERLYYETMPFLIRFQIF